ncbi:MAG: hypothetical protein COW18_05250 [Zetaproteobacteria bacterium CG12_big_fil_rev_8_21_14_0_65_54_13]|nr:MAG: hypothetical protein COX55_09775 [Zetaproteobacteria bacterium CG23_combo_of_CG06-09_8_20_14_all_54_7]PIW49625.1 MAG: hypothetical protein COW18_05250 [Zetaproteobacteria bacterium CG12_big_fil_rev_8_21_14_0_65_54_13]
MIRYQAEFEGYLKAKGIAGKDKKADAVQECIASLQSVAKQLGIKINSKTLGSEEDIATFSDLLGKSGKIPPRVIKKYSVAMQHYVDMVNGL